MAKPVLPIAEQVANAPSWDARVALVRKVPESFGKAQHQAVYAAIAERVYVPAVTADFGYIHWKPGYELAPLEAVYTDAVNETRGFHDVSPADLERVITSHPATLQAFRLLLGLTSAEFAEACSAVAGTAPFTRTAVRSVEAGIKPSGSIAAICAAVIDQMMSGHLFPPPPGGPSLRSKIDKPDTAGGWDSVRHYAANGVPLSMFLHQRAYGGAFRQLLDATSTQRGDVLETPVEELFKAGGIPYLRTGSHNQAEIATRFQLTVRPAPDFVVFDNRTDSLRAILECKGASDGGTARDKAARFGTLRTEAQRLGGIPVFAVLGGVGWRRTGDALGPVVRDTDGRVFTLATLPEMLTVEPLPSLRGGQTPQDAATPSPLTPQGEHRHSGRRPPRRRL